MSIQQEVGEWIELVADEIVHDADGEITSDRACDVERLIWEACDGSEWVIYYGKSAALVNDYASDDEQQDAYENGVLGQDTPDTFREVLTRMAFYVLYGKLTARVEELLDR